MRNICIVVIAAICSLAFAAQAQDTNALKTKIGLFNRRPGGHRQGFQLDGVGSHWRGSDLCALQGNHQRRLRPQGIWRGH